MNHLNEQIATYHFVRQETPTWTSEADFQNHPMSSFRSLVFVEVEWINKDLTTGLNGRFSQPCVRSDCSLGGGQYWGGDCDQRELFTIVALAFLLVEILMATSPNTARVSCTRRFAVSLGWGGEVRCLGGWVCVFCVCAGVLVRLSVGGSMTTIWRDWNRR